MDNLPAHKVAGVAEAIAESHAQLFYLPQYSPDMNPIEMAFANPDRGNPGKSRPAPPERPEARG